jgi:hypothetical protein
MKWVSKFTDVTPVPFYARDWKRPERSQAWKPTVSRPGLAGLRPAIISEQTDQRPTGRLSSVDWKLSARCPKARQSGYDK